MVRRTGTDIGLMRILLVAVVLGALVLPLAGTTSAQGQPAGMPEVVVEDKMPSDETDGADTSADATTGTDESTDDAADTPSDGSADTDVTPTDDDATSDAPADDEPATDDAPVTDDTADAGGAEDESTQDGSGSAEISTEAIEGEPTITEATAVALIDAFGNVVYERGGEDTLPPASITKVMTAMVALDSGIALDEPIAYVPGEYPEDAQLAGYVEGDTPSFGELLSATLIYSANDAAANVAYAVAGSKEAFAELMNAKAAELGLSRTHFMNPHGLEEEGHYSCALDLCTMGRYALEHYPFIRSAVMSRSTTVVADGKTITLPSTDSLMDTYAGLRGIKTGNTQSGTSFLSSARRDRVTLYACVLCCETRAGRFADTSALLDWGFGLYEQRTLATDGLVTDVMPWADGFWLRLPVTAERDVSGSVFSGAGVQTTMVSTGSGMFARTDLPQTITLWRQGRRYVSGVVCRTDETPRRVGAWNPFVLPLFEDTEGRDAA